MLDLIHEDLNRVIKKPYIEMSEELNRPDAVVAKEFWDAFTARNRSIIVDLMYGQLKSTVTCLECGRVATNFDPYLSIQLPIPDPIEKEKKMLFRYVPYEMHNYNEEDDEYILKEMPTLEVKVEPKMNILDVKKQLVEEFMLDIKLSDLVVCNEWEGKTSTTFKDKDLINDISQKREHTLIYHVPKEDPDAVRVEINWYRHVRLNKKNYRIEELDTTIPRFTMINPSLTFLEIKQHIAK